MISDKFKLIIEQEFPSSIMDLRDVMECLHISYRGAYRLIAEDKEIPAWKDDEGMWCALRSDVIAYIDKNGNA